MTETQCSESGLTRQIDLQEATIYRLWHLNARLKRALAAANKRNDDLQRILDEIREASTPQAQVERLFRNG